MTEPAATRLTLPQPMRLRQKREFAEIREKGQRLTRGCLVLNWMSLPSGSVSRVGVITTRKLGKAHLRSRARRLLREAFRLNQHGMGKPAAMVLIARHSIVGRKLADVERDFLSVLRQASLLR